MFSSKEPKTASAPPASGNGPATETGKASGVPSIISPDLKIIGDLKSTGDIQIDGAAEGDIHCRMLTIGERAQIQGSIVADTVRISGTVVGQVKAKSVFLEKSAKMTGDITHENLTMEAGAFFEGHVRHIQNNAGNSPSVGSGASTSTSTSTSTSDKVAQLHPTSGGNGSDTPRAETQRPVV
jgi:cytoskeletal protein CcmA (bactofilin family)